MNNNAAEIAKAPHLQLDITGGIPLTELTVQVNGICAQAEEQTHAVVVLHFTDSSLDLKEWPGQVGIQDVNRWERAVRRLERLATVVIAVASGATCGPALDLLLASDYRIAEADFRLHMPINQGHVWPGMGIYRLVNQVGVARGRQLLMGVHEITAQRALDLGLIDEISDAMLDTMHAAVLRLGPMSSAELSVRRQLLLEAPTTTFEDALGTYLAACDRELRRLQGRGGSEHQGEDGR